MNLIRITGLALLVALSACVAPGASQAPAMDFDAGESNDGVVARGREIAVEHCANCHAIDAGMTSPLHAAPSFKGILARYNPDRLADDLIDGIRVGHDQMPVFDLDVQTADALVAYLKWLDGSG